MSIGAPSSKRAGVSFPDDSVRCAPGDYLLRSEAGGRWKVFLVEDIVQLERLVPLRKDGVVVGLLEEGTVLDSVAPAYMGQVRLLLTAFEAEHASSDQALRAIGSATLGRKVENVCLDIRQFPRPHTLVHTPQAAPALSP